MSSTDPVDITAEVADALATLDDFLNTAAGGSTVTDKSSVSVKSTVAPTSSTTVTLGDITSLRDAITDFVSSMPTESALTDKQSAPGNDLGGGGGDLGNPND